MSTAVVNNIRCEQLWRTSSPGAGYRARRRPTSRPTSPPATWSYASGRRLRAYYVVSLPARPSLNRSRTNRLLVRDCRSIILALSLSWRAACLSRCVSFPTAYRISTDYLQASAPPTLQESQTHALLTLLNLNNTVESSSGSSQPAAKGASLKVAAPSGPPVWKVLVLDQYTKDVLATVLRVQDLRDVGVTLHVWVPKRLVT